MQTLTTSEKSKSTTATPQKGKQQPFFAPVRVQPQLTIGAIDDPYEREADAMADRVMRMPAQKQTAEPTFFSPKPVITPNIQRECATCEEEKVRRKEELHGEEPEALSSILSFDAGSDPGDGTIQRKCAACEEKERILKKDNGGGGGVAVAPSIVHDVVSSGGQQLDAGTRSFFEPRFGHDFSHVRIHTDSKAAESSDAINAHAYTLNNNIVFNQGKYAPDTDDGKRLLAHELTHVVQQGGSVKRYSSDQNHISDSEPHIQRLSLFGYEPDFSWSGVKTLGGLAEDAAVDTAVWAKDQVVGAFTWIYDRIKALADRALNFLTEKMGEVASFVEEKGASVMRSIFESAAEIASPITSLLKAMLDMDAALLGTAWGILKTGAGLVADTIGALVTATITLGEGILDAVSAGAGFFLDAIDDLLDLPGFGLLPFGLKDKAKALIADVRELLQKVMAKMHSFFDWLRSLVKAIRDFADKVVSWAIDAVIEALGKIRQVYDFIKNVADDPEAAITPIIDQLAGKITAEGPASIQQVKSEQMAQALPDAQRVSAGTGVIQRSANGKVKRSVASVAEIDTGLRQAFATEWANLSFGPMLKESLLTMFWPPATIQAIGSQIHDLWSVEWAGTMNNFFMPRSVFDDFGGFFHDIWSNILNLLDFPIALWRAVNNILMLLMGYITVLLVLIGAVGGAILGGGVGALPGAMVGLEIAGGLGEVLFASFMEAETVTVLKDLLELHTGRQTDMQKRHDYKQIIGSIIGMGIAVLLMVAFAILGSFISSIVRAVKGRRVAAPVREVAVDTAPAAEIPEPMPAEQPRAPAPESEVHINELREEIVSEADILSERPVNKNGEMHESVLSEKGVGICSPFPCPLIEKVYKAELSANPEFAQRYEWIKELRDIGQIDAAAEQAADLTQDLIDYRQARQNTRSGGISSEDIQESIREDTNYTSDHGSTSNQDNFEKPTDYDPEGYRDTSEARERGEANQRNGVTGEDIVREELQAGLAEDQVLLEQESVTLDNGLTSKPDFIVIDARTGEVIKVVDSKVGSSRFRTNQRYLKANGGIIASGPFAGAHIPPGMLRSRPVQLTPVP